MMILFFHNSIICLSIVTRQEDKLPDVGVNVHESKLL